jgi:hypothetical protein
MSSKTLKWLIVLTGVYLLCELSFNARLLDVVGGNATGDEIHHIERYGRLLSGTAAALFLLQFLLPRQFPLSSQFRKIFIGIALSGCIYGVYNGLEKLVDTLVDSSSPVFRRQAVNLSLIQRALVHDRVILSGMDETLGLYRKPEGKAFLALFPLLAISVEDLDEKIEQAKKELLKHSIAEKIGGVQEYYDKAYIKAIHGVTEQWKEYRGDKLGPYLDAKIRLETEKVFMESWRNYLVASKRCYRNGTQKTLVTEGCLQQLDNKARQYLHDANWQSGDQVAFRAGIEKQVREEEIQKIHTEGMVIRGKKVPPRLSQAQFIAHPAVQEGLREQLNLPQTTTIPLTIDRQGFIHQLYEPMLEVLTTKELENYNAPALLYADGASLAEPGRTAARAVLVPPVALFFSLLGALGHLGKLTYLLSKLAVSSRKNVKGLLLIPLILIVAIWVVFSQMDNPITQSRLYTALRQQALHQADEEGELLLHPLRARALLNVIHVVAVGQSFAYPFNEGLREHVLLGFDFGYIPENEKKE